MDSNASFSIEEDIALAEYLNIHFCLNNIKSQAQQKVYEIDEISWKEISDHLQKSVDVCKERWKMIQSTQEEKKVNNKTIATKDTIELLLADNLSSVASTSGTQEISNILSNQNNIKHESAIAIQNPGKSESQTSEIAFQQTGQSVRSKKLKAPEESKGAKRAKQNKSLYDIWKKRNERKNKHILSMARENVNIDPIDAFFKCIAITVKQFPVGLRIRAKLDFVRLLSRMEVRNFRLNK